MTEWHLPPDYITSNWTDELLDLMVNKLVERKEREKRVMDSGGKHTVSDNELFSRAGHLIKRIK